MKKIIILIIILIVDIILIGYFTHKLITLNDYTNSIYVVTSSNGHTMFYELNNYGRKREVPRFEYNYDDIYYLKGCFDSHLEETCRVTDINDNDIEYDETISKIIKKTSLLEKNILTTKIIKEKDNYYVITELNVNWHSPYNLYKYDNNNLIKIYTFENEEVIAIKEDLWKEYLYTIV